MRRIDPQYHVVIDPEQRLPSWMVALLPAGADDPGVTAAIGYLEDSDLDVADRRMAAEREMEDARWELEVDLRWEGDDGVTSYRVWLEPAEQLEEVHLELGYLEPEDLEASRSAQWSIGVSTRFGDNPLQDFHHQVQLLATVAPKAVVTYDISASWPRSGDWLRDTASARVPPSPENLYSVHAVMDPDASDRVWLHTHGLLRCGTIELEMLDAPAEHAATLCNLLGAAAAMTLELGPPPPEEPFLVGQGLELVWLPWDKGLSHVPRGVSGSTRDRDEYHSHPSGILFAPGEKWLGLFGSRFRNPERYLSILEDNPLLYVSNLETARMSRLATERLHRFLKLFEQQSTSEDWLFLVKLGYAVDHAEEPDDREHLWFQVHGVEDSRFDATLINAPYGIARMHEGQRDLHDRELLSDWSVHCPHGSFDPDSVGQLERLTGQESNDEIAEA
jgi:uncharacterized protein YegJ (DUF2314 family)